MIHPNANDTQTARSVFVIGPDKKIKLTLASRPPVFECDRLGRGPREQSAFGVELASPDHPLACYPDRDNPAFAEASGGPVASDPWRFIPNGIISSHGGTKGRLSSQEDLEVSRSG